MKKTVIILILVAQAFLFQKESRAQLVFKKKFSSPVQVPLYSPNLGRNVNRFESGPIIRTTDGGYILMGGTSGILPGPGSPLPDTVEAYTTLTKFDKAHNKLWLKIVSSQERASNGGDIYGGIHSMYSKVRSFSSSEEDKSAGLIMAGTYTDIGTFEDKYFMGRLPGGAKWAPTDIIVSKLDAVGNIIASIGLRDVDDTLDEERAKIIPTLDGGYFLAYQVNENVSIHGGTISPPHGNSSPTDVIIVKLDNNLNVQWSKKIGQASPKGDISKVDWLGGILQMPSDSSYIVCGTNWDFNGSRTALFMTKFSENGNPLWYNSYEASLIDTLQGGSLGFPEVMLNSKNELILSGDYSFGCCPPLQFVNTFGTNLSRSFIIKTDNSGNIIWNKSYGTNGMVGFGDIFFDKLKETNDGRYYTVSGNILSKLNDNGEVIFIKKHLGGMLNSFILNEIDSCDNGLLIASRTRLDLNNFVEWQEVLMKTDKLGYAGGCNEYDVLNPIIANFPFVKSNILSTSMPIVNYSPIRYLAPLKQVPPFIVYDSIYCVDSNSFDFTSPKRTLCLNETTSFNTNVDTLCNTDSVKWLFPGAVPSISRDLNPQNISYSGLQDSFDVTLIVFYPGYSDTLTKTKYIAVKNPLATINGSSANFQDTVLCPPSTNFVDLVASGGDTYIWDPSPTGVSNILQRYYFAFGDETFVLYATIGGCIDTAQIIVNTMDLTASATADTVCLGLNNQVVLNLSDSSLADQIIWSTGLTDSTSFAFTTSNDTSISVDIINNLCSDTISLNVQINVDEPAMVNIAGDSMICLGDAKSYFPNPLMAGVDFAWAYGSVADTGLNFNLSPSLSDYLTLTVDANACGPITDSMWIDVINPNIKAGPDTSIAPGSSVVLYVTKGASYVWTPATGLDCQGCQYPVVNPEKSTTYFVTVTDSFGCTAVDTVNIDLTNVPLFVPNAFSPGDGNGFNDLFNARGRIFEQYLIRIYDRYGNKVFEAKNIKDGWDGKYKGKPLNSGVYVYYIEAKEEGEEKMSLKEKGNLTLIR